MLGPNCEVALHDISRMPRSSVVLELVQAQRAIASMTSLDGGGDLERGSEDPGGGDIRDVVEGMIRRIAGDTSKSPKAMSLEEKVDVVRRLEDHSVRLAKRLIKQVADALDLSRHHHLQLPERDSSWRTALS
jgi:predicted transcriptional regulator YheO